MLPRSWWSHRSSQCAEVGLCWKFTLPFLLSTLSWFSGAVNVFLILRPLTTTTYSGLQFLETRFILFYFCVYVCLCVWVACPQKPEEGVRSPVAGLSVCCEPHNGNKLGSFTRAWSTLSLWVVSLALEFSFCYFVHFSFPSTIFTFISFHQIGDHPTHAKFKFWL